MAFQTQGNNHMRYWNLPSLQNKRNTYTTCKLGDCHNRSGCPSLCDTCQRPQVCRRHIYFHLLSFFPTKNNSKNNRCVDQEKQVRRTDLVAFIQGLQRTPPRFLSTAPFVDGLRGWEKRERPSGHVTQNGSHGSTPLTWQPKKRLIVWDVFRLAERYNEKDLDDAYVKEDEE